MWEPSRKTANELQTASVVLTVALALWSLTWAGGGLLSFSMQMSAVFGAGWALRLHPLQPQGRLLRLGRGFLAATRQLQFRSNV